MHQFTSDLSAIAKDFHGAALRVCRSLLMCLACVVVPAAAYASGLGEEAPQAVEDNSSDNIPELAEPLDVRPMRKFLGFATDAAVARGLWIELGEVYREDSSFVTSMTAAYGWRAWEFGGDIAVRESGSFNNLHLWTKYVGWKLGAADVGAGLLTEIPTSHGDFDAGPFVTGSLPVGRWNLRSSFRYVITEDFFYDAACLGPIGEHTDFRAEFTGRFNDNFGGHRVELLPGFDFHFVRGDWRMLVRLSAGAELHPSFGAVAGLSFVLAGA